MAVDLGSIETFVADCNKVSPADFAAKGHLNVKVGFLLTRQRMGFDMVLGQNRLYEARLELSVMRAVFLRYFISAKAVLTFGQLLGLSPR